MNRNRMVRGMIVAALILFFVGPLAWWLLLQIGRAHV
jgi:hypothetical protein